jgi:hypothetical protein
VIFVVTKERGEYDSRWDQPIAVRANFVDAKKVAEANIEPPGENYRMESVTTELVDFEIHKYYVVISSWRSLILPAMEPTKVHGPTIWSVEDHG